MDAALAWAVVADRRAAVDLVLRTLQGSGAVTDPHRITVGRPGS